MAGARLPNHSRPRGRIRSAFTLVELVMVVTIISIVAAIAVPRVSTAASRASGNALEATIANVRMAVDTFYAEHGRYPGYNAATGLPDNNAFADQLLLYSNAQGATSATYGYPYIYGPYLRAPFPKNPTNTLDTVQVKASPGDADPSEGSVGWVAVLSHGFFGISATAVDLTDIGIKTLDIGKVRAK